MGHTSDIILSLRGLKKIFGAQSAVKGVDVDFKRGEYFCVLGPSGCGKTTVLRMIGGFEHPSEGQILLDGRDVAGVPPEARDVNTVFQSYALFPHMTIRQNIEFGPRMKRWSPEQVRERVDEVVKVIQLVEHAHKYPDQLSGGQRQRVALARALVNRPQVLLLDEPLAALDKNLRSSMQYELRRIQREFGTTFIQVTHDQEEALVLSDRIGIMHGGLMVQVGSPDEVYSKPATPFVAEFLGAANMIEGAHRPGPTAGIEVAPGFTVELSEPAPGIDAGIRVKAMVRPENISLRINGDAGTPGTHPAVVRRVQAIGGEVEIMLGIGEETLHARLTRTRDLVALAAGDKVGVFIDPRDVVTFTGKREG